jgi:hypothetical protein
MGDEMGGACSTHEYRILIDNLKGIDHVGYLNVWEDNINIYGIS